MYPKILQLGPLPIHSYGILLAAAFLVSTALLARLLEREGVARSRAWDLGFVVIVSGLLGAKLLMVFTNWSYYGEDLSRLWSLEFWRAGGAFFGGLLGATLSAWLYVRRDPGLKFSRVADAAAPAIALGQAVGRLGCFAAGCDYGRPTDVAWAVSFTSEYAHQNVGIPLNVPLHPVQLYEAVGALLIFAALLWLHRRRRFDGQIISLYFVAYGALRFVNEFYRGDREPGFWISGLASVHQLISLLLVLVGISIFWLFRSRSGAKPSGAR